MRIVRRIIMIKETQYCNACASQYTVQWLEQDVDEDLMPTYCPFCGEENFGEFDPIETDEFE